MKKIIIFFISILLAISLPIKIEAHSGGTDSSGCHVCRTNCAQYGLTTGQYHCHSSSRPSTNTNTNRPSSNTTSPSTNNNVNSNESNGFSIWRIGIIGMALYFIGKYSVKFIRKRYEVYK
jgi:hypothetical protein